MAPYIRLNNAFNNYNYIYLKYIIDEKNMAAIRKKDIISAVPIALLCFSKKIPSVH